MKPEIKERIEKIKRGEVPGGYIKIKKYILPKDWKVEKLGNLVEKIVGGGTPPRKNLEFYNGNIPWATVKDLTEDNYKYRTIEYITKAGLENSNTKLIKEGGFIISTRMGLGRGFINKAPMAINQDLKGIYPTKEKLHVEFLMYWYRWLGSYIQYLGDGSTVKGIDLDTLKSLDLRITDLQEQRKIAQILSTWDKAIELKEKLIEEKKKQKKGLMQLLLTGEKRLPGFKVEWKKVKLGKISNITTGNKDTKDKVDNGLYPFFVRSEKIERITSYSYDGEAVLIPGDGKIGDIYHYINGKFDFHQRVYKISNFAKNVCGKFVYFYLRNFFKKQAMKYSAKATVDSLRRPMLTEMDIMLPRIKEQEAIAKVLNIIDKQINLLEQELEALKLQKKGLMQLLLTGIVRVGGDKGE